MFEQFLKFAVLVIASALVAIFTSTTGEMVWPILAAGLLLYVGFWIFRSYSE